MAEVYYINRGLRKTGLDKLSSLKGKMVWIDLTDLTKEEGDLLQDFFGLHPLTTEDLFSEDTRIKVEEFDKYMFSVFYGIKKSRDLVKIDFILGRNFLITHHKKESQPFVKLKNNEKEIFNLLKQGPEYVFHRLIDDEIDYYFPIIDKIEDDIEDLEDLAMGHPSKSVLSDILDLKKKIIQIRRTMISQREKLFYITQKKFKFISESMMPYFRDVHDHSVKVLNSVEASRTSIADAFDAYMSSMSNRMNEVMKTLSIIATIALPLSVISGIWGTNFDFLPGQHSANGFALMVSLMIAVIFVMLAIFKKRKWI